MLIIYIQGTELFLSGRTIAASGRFAGSGQRCLEAGDGEGLPVDHLSEEFSMLLEAADYEGLAQLLAGVEAILGLLFVDAAHHAADGLHYQRLSVRRAIQQQYTAEAKC